MLWYWGPGARRRAHDEHPDAFVKTCDRWWDGYNDEEVVITECFRHPSLSHEVCAWGDHHAFRCEIRRGMLLIRPKLVIVTSDRHPSKLWGGYRLEKVLRRYKCVEVAL